MRSNEAIQPPANRCAIFLAFHKRPAEAMAALGDPQTASAQRIAGLILWHGLDRPQEAVPHLARGPLHDPVALVELDQLYEQLGMTGEQEGLLNSAPHHRLVIERKAQLTLTMGRPEETLRLLDSIRWPLEHQRYIRTQLWVAARRKLGLTAEPVPEDLGEDDLAPFGAYWSD